MSNKMAKNGNNGCEMEILRDFQAKEVLAAIINEFLLAPPIFLCPLALIIKKNRISRLKKLDARFLLCEKNYRGFFRILA